VIQIRLNIKRQEEIRVSFHYCEVEVFNSAGIAKTASQAARKSSLSRAVSCQAAHVCLSAVICTLLNSGLSAAEAETSGEKRAVLDTRDSRKRKKKKSREYRRGDVSVSLAL